MKLSGSQKKTIKWIKKELPHCDFLIDSVAYYPTNNLIKLGIGGPNHGVAVLIRKAFYTKQEIIVISSKRGYAHRQFFVISRKSFKKDLRNLIDYIECELLEEKEEIVNNKKVEYYPRDEAKTTLSKSGKDYDYRGLAIRPRPISREKKKSPFAFFNMMDPHEMSAAKDEICLSRSDEFEMKIYNDGLVTEPITFERDDLLMLVMVISRTTYRLLLRKDD